MFSNFFPKWFLVIVQLDAQILFQCIYLFIVLYTFRACHAHHQEKQIASIQHLVIVTPCWWQCRVHTNSFQCIYLFIYSSLHVSSVSCSSSGETNCINTASGNCHSVLVAVSCAHKFFSMYLFIYSSLHVSSVSCSSSGETNCINTASGNCHSVLVAVSCAGWE